MISEISRSNWYIRTVWILQDVLRLRGRLIIHHLFGRPFIPNGYNAFLATINGYCFLL